MRNKKFKLGAIIVVGVVCIYAFFHSSPNSESNHGGITAKEYERGPHRGRMLREGNFALEITIFEENVPPEFHVYAYEDDKLLDSGNIELVITINRLDGEMTKFNFNSQNNYLKGDGIIHEPHSFDVKIQAIYKEKTYVWEYASYEGRTNIDGKIAKTSGIEIDKIGPAIIKETIPVSGCIVLNSNTTANVKARFPGVIRSVKKEQGETVNTGELLATVESSDSLKTYSIISPLDGTVISRNANVGDIAGEAPLFVVTDLSKLWAEFNIFPRDITRIQSGQKVCVNSLENAVKSNGDITIVLPLTEASTQTVVARVLLDNSNNMWRPGMRVQGNVIVNERKVLLAAKTTGLQTFRDFTVVFARLGDTYEVRMLELGLKDDEYIEILGGIKPDTDYVSKNSFLIKADIEKSSASHDH